MIQILFTHGRYLARPISESARIWLASYAANRAAIQHAGDGVLIDTRFLSDFVDAARKSGLAVERI
jgi:hypothetical protein